MKRIITAGWMLAVACGFSGCGRSDGDGDKISARSPTETVKAEKVVTRWKEANLKHTGYGMIVEQEGTKVAATLYRVEPGDGFVIKEKESEGKFYPDRRQIVFPLYMQGIFSVDDWVKAQGSHVVVPFDPMASGAAAATNIVGELKDMARKSTYQFVRLPSEALPSTLNSATAAKP